MAYVFDKDRQAIVDEDGARVVASFSSKTGEHALVGLARGVAMACTEGLNLLDELCRPGRETREMEENYRQRRMGG